MLFFLSEVIPALADEAVPFTTVKLQSESTDIFERHRLELGMVNPAKVFGFNADEPPQLFADASIAEIEPNSWDLDYLWRNASRVPITSIPEPSSSSLLIGGTILLCLRRIRKKST